MTFSALDSRLVGPLFATDAMRAAFADEARLKHMIAVEAALARAQAQRGLAPAALAEAIAAVTPADLSFDALGAATAVAGVPTIPFVKAMQKHLPTELEPHLHKGATTQDVVDTALVLAMREGLDLIGAELSAILPALARLAQEHRATPCVGRTYGQHAAPITFGFKVAVWLSGLTDAAATLPALRERALVASLGGPVGTLAGLREHGPAVLDAFAAELGLSATVLAWHTNRSRIAALGAWLAELIGALAKMAGDVAHLASTEVGEVAEPSMPGRGGSSAMPHKRNPVGATMILAAHGAAAGLVVPLLAAQAAQHERPAGAWHGEWHALPQLFGLASGALREARALAEGLHVDTERMRGNLDLTRGLLFADAAAARLAPRLGREAAHHLVERAAGQVRAGEGSLRDVLARDSAIQPGDRVEQAFDLAPAVAAAGPWIDRAVAAAEAARAALLTPEKATHAPA